MLKALESDLANKTFTADALLTQTKLADFLIGRALSANMTETPASLWNYCRAVEMRA